MNPVCRLVHIELARDLIRGRLEFLDTLTQPASNLRNSLGSENEQDGQEYEYEFKRSQASHVSAGWKRSEVQLVSVQTTIRLFGGSSSPSSENPYGVRSWVQSPVPIFEP